MQDKIELSEQHMQELLQEYLETSGPLYLRDAVAYLRYSSHMQDGGVSLEYQMQEIEDYAKKCGYKIVKWYIDKATSAKAVAGRDNFIQLFKDVDAKSIPDTLIIWAPNRAFRNAIESALYREKLKNKGFKLLSVKQIIDDESTSGRLMTDLIARIDQYKVEEIGEHVSSALRLLVNEGFFAGGPVPYGYKSIKVIHNGKERAKLVPNEYEAVVVRELFKRVAAGATLSDVVTYFKDNGVVSRKGNPFQWESLRKILRNVVYKGERHYNMKSGDDAYSADYCQPLVSKQLFDAANREHDSRQGATNWKKKKRLYPMTGKLTCSCCGYSFVGQNSNGYGYYRCQSWVRQKSCNIKGLPKEKIEKMVFDTVVENILSDKAIDEISRVVLKKVKKAPKEENDKKELSVRKATLEAEIADIVQMKLDGKVSESTMVRMTTDKEAELEDVSKKLARLEMAFDGNIDAAFIKKHIKSIFNKNTPFEKCSGEMLKELFDKTVHNIDVSNTQVIIHLRLAVSEFTHNANSGSTFFELCVTIDR